MDYHKLITESGYVDDTDYSDDEGTQDSDGEGTQDSCAPYMDDVNKTQEDKEKTEMEEILEYEDLEDVLEEGGEELDFDGDEPVGVDSFVVFDGTGEQQ